MSQVARVSSEPVGCWRLWQVYKSTRLGSPFRAWCEVSDDGVAHAGCTHDDQFANCECGIRFIAGAHEMVRFLTFLDLSKRRSGVRHALTLGYPSGPVRWDNDWTYGWRGGSSLYAPAYRVAAILVQPGDDASGLLRCFPEIPVYRGDFTLANMRDIEARGISNVLSTGQP